MKRWLRCDGFNQNLQKWKIHSDPQKHIVPKNDIHNTKPTRLEQTRQLRPGGLIKITQQIFGLARHLALAGQKSHGLFCSSRIQTLLKDYVLFVVRPIVIWSQKTGKNFQPLKVPFHRVSVFNVTINYCAENILANTIICLLYLNNFTNFQNSPWVRGPNWPGPNWTTAELCAVKGAGNPMWDAPSQNYCSTHKNGLSSLTGCITWTCGESERVRAVMVIEWSSNHGDRPDDQKCFQFIKILSKSYVWCCCNIKTATDDCQIWNDRSPKSEKYA